MNWFRHTHVTLGGAQVVGRRDFLKGISAAAVASGTLSWTDLMRVKADELRRQGMSCILLWMQGGPSQFETFSPKPGHDNGGEIKAISTNVTGLEVSANFPKMAGVMDRVALIRSMTSKEGNHQRASFFLHTGYLPVASVKHPTLGSIVAQQLPNPESQLPSFVRIGNRGRGNGGAGFLGVDYDPFQLVEAEALPPNTKLTTSPERYQRRLGLMQRLESDYAAAGAQKLVDDHRKLYEKTARMITSAQMTAFDLDQEPESLRQGYGEGKFAASCLLARRLVESGVTFVEVMHGNWDTHDDVFGRTAKLTSEVDQPFAQLILDLEQRGMLDKTLVVWMGEFGRTPKINPRGGRDHFPRAFNVAMAGGGVRGGRVIGQTDDGGTEVTDRPVTVPDLFQTFCKSLNINAGVENMSGIGRPIKIVDGGEPVSELFA